MRSFECPGCGKTSLLQNDAGNVCPACGQATDVQGFHEADRTLPLSNVEPSAVLADQMPTLANGPAKTAKAPKTLAGSLETLNAQNSGSDVRQINYSLPPRKDNDQARALVIDFLAPAQDPGEIGRLGPYRILQVLGHGGMGVVFKAEDPGLMRLVAVKAMLPAVARSPDARSRFLREARHAANLKDPHVVTIFQVGEEHGTPYLAMEFLEGESLDALLERSGTLPIDDVLEIGKQIAMGLAAAHDRKLIHRDIKPGNIWMEAGARGQEAGVRSQGSGVRGQESGVRGQESGIRGQRRSPLNFFHVKLLDFGLARSSHEDTLLTQLGQIVGTPAYMAPEQAEGVELDQRCDLYSLGCVLYRMCTGTTPFKGPSAISLLRALALETPARPESVNPLVPRTLSDLIMRLLAKKPDQRPASAHEVLTALDAIENEYSPDAPEDHRRPVEPDRTIRSTSLATVLFWGVTLVAAAVLGVVFWPSVSALFQNKSEDANAQAVAPIDPGNADPGKKSPPEKSVDPGKTKDGPGKKKDPDKKKDPGTQEPKAGKPLREARFVPRPPRARAPFDAKQARAHQGAWAAYLERKVESKNSIDMKMVLIPPGEFTMGASAEEIEDVDAKVQKFAVFRDYLKSEGPQHRVVLTRPFLMSAHPVTVDEYRAVMTKDGDKPAPSVPDAKSADDTGSLPQMGIGWLDACEFCNRLSRREGLRPCYGIDKGNARPIDGNGYRLPTEAEWEFACRAGTTTRYFFGDTTERMADHRTHNKLKPIGQHKSNPFGLHEMVGVATTWCQDNYDAKYYQTFAEQTAVDPQGPPTGTSWVTRGGFFGDFSEAFRSARRWSSKDGAAVKYIAMRIVRSLEVPSAYVNRLGMEFAFVPRGKVWHGGGGETGNSGIDIAYDFFLGTCEVTQGEWEAVVGPSRNNSRFSRRGQNRADVANVSDEDLKRFPVDNVSWNDCQQFVALLNDKVQEKGWRYRLPTTDEWEYACRGGPGQKKEDYGFDFYLEGPLSDLPGGRANTQAAGLMRTCKVGSYSPNRLGLYDMHGNVFEWCEGAIKTDGVPTTLRSYCGGCFNDAPNFCRALQGGVGERADHLAGSGLRLARVAEKK